MKVTSLFLALKLIIISTYSVFAHAGVQCRTIFDRAGTETEILLSAHRADGVSMFYTPVVVSKNGEYFANGRVLVQSYARNRAGPVKAIILRFVDEASGLYLPVGRTLFHETGLNAIYKSYGPRVNPNIIEHVIKVEKSLPLDRQATYISLDETHQKAYGFIRIFDGSVHPHDARVNSSVTMPAELVLESMNKSTTIFAEKREAGYAIYEVGKYFIDDLLNPAIAADVKADIFRWWISYIDTQNANEKRPKLFFGHVASKAHATAYRRYFGFGAVERSKSVGLELDEDILQVDSVVLREFLVNGLKNLNIPR